MINDYLDPAGKLYCAPCREVIPNVRRLLAGSHERGWAVLYVNTALEDPMEPLARKWGLHAQRGSWGGQVVPELMPLPTDTVLAKKTYDAFYETDLNARLREAGAQRTVVAGIHTHVCVLATALGAFYRGFDVVVPEDCVAASTPESHETRLAFVRTHIGVVTNLQELLAEPREWKPRN